MLRVIGLCQVLSQEFPGLAQSFKPLHPQPSKQRLAAVCPQPAGTEA